MPTIEESPASASGGRKDLLSALALGGLLLGVYHLGLLPSVPATGDTAKLQLVGAVWGTPHTSGYPTWTVLANLFHRLLPFGDPPAHANLLTALFSVAGSLCLFAAARLLGAGRWPAAALALSMAWTPTLWSQSVRAEVYSLHYALMMAVVWLLLRWRRDRQDLLLGLALALYAFSFSNHLTAVCFGPAVLAFVLLVESRALLRPKVVAGAAGGAAAGLGAYGYIVWRSSDPAVPFLEMQASGWLDLLGQLAGDPKRSHFFETGLGAVLGERLPLAFLAAIRELHLLLPLVVLGALAALLSRKPETASLRPFLDPPAVLLGLAALGNLAFVSTFTVPDSIVYHIPFFALLVLFAARGIAALQTRWPGLARPKVSSVFLLLPLVFLLPRIPEALEHGQRRLSLDARLRAELARPPAGGAVLLSTDYERSMGLLYRALEGRLGLGGDPEGDDGAVHVLHAAPASLSAGPAFAPLQRYLAEGLPLRTRERPRPIAAGLPVYCSCVRPSHAEALEKLGFAVRDEGDGLYRLTAWQGSTPPLPRAFVVHRLQPAADLVEALSLLSSPTFDPRTTAVVLGREGGGGPAGSWNISEAAYEEERIELTVETTEPGWLVLSEVFPARWRVEVDGRRAERIEVDLLYSAVALPAGRHRVRILAD